MRTAVLIRIAALLALLAGALILVSASGPFFSEHDKAYYLKPADATFIRPGLVIKVTKAEIAADGTIRAWYKLTDPKGVPLDREGVYSPGAVSVSFIAAYILKGSPQYMAYTTRQQISPITGANATQATGESSGRTDKIADGEYVYTFTTKVPAGFDKTVTHSIGAYGSRNLDEFELGRQYDDDVFNFVPDGSKVTVVRDVIRTATCNKCHHDMAFHGGSRKTMELCVLCHTPQTWDPDTINTVDMVTMTHKIHMGSQLPSVRKGKKYQIIGNQQSVHDYSAVVFPADPRNCTACHETNTGAAQARNLYRANMDACGSCHDDVNFKTGEGHLDLPQVNDNQCASCHIPRGELDRDASIVGAHVIPRLSQTLPGVVFEIKEVIDAAPGKFPTVTFTLKDKSGKPIPPSSLSRLNLRLAGPNGDYGTSPITEDVRRAECVADGRCYWTLQTAIPADAQGSYTFSMDGRVETKLLEGTKKEVAARDSGANKVIYFSVDGSKTAPRRSVVATAKCNACHGALAFHGEAYNAVENCVVCHTPTRVAGTGAAAVSVDFRNMIHKIHAGQSLSRGYRVGNYNFSTVGYPGLLTNCVACHVGGSEQLPAKGAASVVDPSAFLNPMGPSTTACLSCHDTQIAASHALANTTRQGESCATCHGPSGDFSVNRVHAR